MGNRDEASLVGLAGRAYFYYFPLVFNLDQVQRLVTTGIGRNPPVPWNGFSHAETLAGPEDTFVTINNDTLYSIAQLDLGVGPLLLRLPDTAGRYYVMQMVDAWTNNFAYLGHRATGTGQATYLLVPPDWSGTAPEGARVVRVPTRLATIVGRWAVGDADDIATVRALQARTTLTPLDRDATPAGLPAVSGSSEDPETFFAKAAAWSAAFPPAPRDIPLQESFAALGIGAQDDDDELREIRARGFAEGSERLRGLLASGGGNPVVNGWNLAYHSFDYNLDYFEIGSLDEPEFKITDPERRIGQRAGAALGGLWGNQAFEAAYIATYVDDRGEELTGEHTYELRLSPPPPVGAFWSLTMYDVPDYYLVANPIDRYSIGDREPGLAYEDDGSLVITISHTEPADDVARANWLPAPPGPFRPVMRMYEPDRSILEQRYLVPPIVRIS